MDPVERDPAMKNLGPAGPPPVPGAPVPPAGATPAAAAAPAPSAPAAVRPMPAAPARPRRRLLVLRCVLALIACDAALLLGAAVSSRLLGRTLGPDVAAFNLAMVFAEASGAIAALVFLALLGGRKALRVSRDEMASGLSGSRYALGLAGALCAVSVGSTLADGTPLLPDWPLQVLVTVALCLCVGVVEEGMYRGLLMGGLLERSGGTRAGVMRAMVISSVVFGAAHLTPVDTLDAVTVLQLVLKFLQAGMLGFFFAGLALRTRSPWPGALTHALWDILLMSSSALFERSIEVEYVSTGEDAVWLVGYYAFIMVLQIPLVVAAVRAWKAAPSPYRGWLHKPLPGKKNVAPVPAVAPAAPVAAPAAPVAPAGLPVPPVGYAPSCPPAPAVPAAPQPAAPAMPCSSGSPVPPWADVRPDAGAACPPPRPEGFAPPVDARPEGGPDRVQ